jgi:hypothetical protein
MKTSKKMNQRNLKLKKTIMRNMTANENGRF